MELDIPSKRVRVDDILSTYNIDFLEKHNFFNIGTDSTGALLFRNISFSAIAKTKYGYLAVNHRDYITYVGNGIWSVTKDDSTKLGGKD